MEQDKQGSIELCSLYAKRKSIHGALPIYRQPLFSPAHLIQRMGDLPETKTSVCTILIYGGVGTCLPSANGLLNAFQSLYPHTTSQIIHTPSKLLSLLSRTSTPQHYLLVIPGGRDKHYLNSFEQSGCHAIRRFVKRGGKYLGICGGAYFAAGICEFERGRSEYEVVGRRFIGLWRGRAVGSVVPGFEYDGLVGESMVEVIVEDEEGGGGWEMEAYVNGGCAFVDTFQRPFS